MEQIAGRTGITFDQVASIADAIAARGDRPTLRGVRAELGTGSMGTIQKHLAAWQGQRRQIVTSAATLPTEIQRVILSEIEREVGAARAELEGDLAATRGDRDALADDNEQQTEQIEQQTARLVEIEAICQQQVGRIRQLESDLITRADEIKRERDESANARQALAKSELRLEALPRLEADAERLRGALETAQGRATAAEQQAAVTASELKAAERRATEAEEREQATLVRAADAEKQSAHARQAEQQARIAEQAAQARLEAAAREIEQARKAAQEARAEAKTAGEQAAELRGKLSVSEAKPKVSRKTEETATGKLSANQN